MRRCVAQPRRAKRGAVGAVKGQGLAPLPVSLLVASSSTEHRHRRDASPRVITSPGPWLHATASFHTSSFVFVFPSHRPRVPSWEFWNVVVVKTSTFDPPPIKKQFYCRHRVRRTFCFSGAKLQESEPVWLGFENIEKSSSKHLLRSIIR